MIMGFIDTMRSEGHAVESTCRVLREQDVPVESIAVVYDDPGERVLLT